MNAIKSKNTTKQLIIIFSMLLFLFSYVENLFSQSTVLSKPTGLNTWTPPSLPPSMMDPLAVVRTNFTVTMPDGVIIDCLKWVPVITAPSGGWPTVIMVHGYGDSKETLSEFCRLQAEYGYYTMTFSVRGQGLSTGLSNLISRTEAEDLKRIVNFVRADVAGGVGPDKIMIMGGSQGGLLPLMAASTGGLNVKAIINSVAPPNFASNWIENGCVKMTLLWTIGYTPDTAKYNSQVTRMTEWIYMDNKKGWDSLSYWLPKDRDFVTILGNNQVPVLIEASWQDKFFNADGWLQNIHRVNSPMTSYMGAVIGHGGDISANENTWHMDLFNNWFFQYLWGMQTNVLTQAKYQYASTTAPFVAPYWSFTHDSSSTLLKDISTPVRLYFNKNNKLKTTVNNSGWFLPDMEFLVNDVNSNYTLKQAVLDEFKGTNFTSKFKEKRINYESSPLTASFEMTGTPTMKIDYVSIAKPFVQFNFQVYEVFPNGDARFVTRLNYMDRNNDFNCLPSRKQVTFRGQAHSHVFSTGSKIRIVLTNLDRTTEEAAFFNTNPFVLPSMDRGIHDLLLTGNFYIDLPVAGPNMGSSLNHLFNETSDAGNTAPVKFSLTQNYPNPFNPSTKIEYAIAKSEKVELKVYDLLGKEIQSLVSEVQGPGSYSVTFHATNLSSGIYFYRLTAGSFTEVKKMTLVK